MAIAFATVRRAAYTLGPTINTVQLSSLADLAGKPVSVVGTVRGADSLYNRTYVRVRVPNATPSGYRGSSLGTVAGVAEVIVWVVGPVA